MLVLIFYPQFMQTVIREAILISKIKSCFLVIDSSFSFIISESHTKHLVKEL